MSIMCPLNVQKVSKTTNFVQNVSKVELRSKEKECVQSTSIIVGPDRSSVLNLFYISDSGGEEMVSHEMLKFV